MLTRILPPRAFALLCLTPRLLERLVVEHHLNVLHLDADTVWFANPYPLFKTLYASYSLIIQTDNPFVNAGILYVQNVADGDAAHPHYAYGGLWKNRNPQSGESSEAERADDAAFRSSTRASFVQ